MTFLCLWLLTKALKFQKSGIGTSFRVSAYTSIVFLVSFLAIGYTAYWLGPALKTCTCLFSRDDALQMKLFLFAYIIKSTALVHLISKYHSASLKKSIAVSPAPLILFMLLYWQLGFIIPALYPSPSGEFFDNFFLSKLDYIPQSTDTNFRASLLPEKGSGEITSLALYDQVDGMPCFDVRINGIIPGGDVPVTPDPDGWINVTASCPKKCPGEAYVIQVDAEYPESPGTVRKGDGMIEGFASG